jgi:hypothetical protein
MVRLMRQALPRVRAAFPESIRDPATRYPNRDLEQPILQGDIGC